MASCRHGHPYPENLRFTANGWRYCAECHREKCRRWRPGTRTGLSRTR
jgi:hypothetical protein